jgi:hypothetical protein
MNLFDIKIAALEAHITILETRNTALAAYTMNQDFILERKCNEAQIGLLKLEIKRLGEAESPGLSAKYSRFDPSRD